MPFLRTDDNYSEDDRFEQVSFSARWLHFCALEYCARKLTDGHIKKSKVLRVSDVDDPAVAAEELVEAGLWETTAVGYFLPDYLRMNRTRVQVESERALAKKRKDDWLARNSVKNDKKNAVPNTVNNDRANGSLPYPSPPVGEGEGKEADGVSRCERGYPVARDGACCPDHLPSERKTA